MTGFIQAPPELGNQYRDDRLLQSCLRRLLPPEMLAEIEPGLLEMGELAGGELYRLQLADRPNEPRLWQWDAWGNRIDEIEHTRLWLRAAELAARTGLVAIPYETTHGAHARIHQAALVYLFTPSTDIYSCPLAMSDGAVRTLLDAGEPELVERAVPRLVSRDPARCWTSGQWMTESTGGSDVGLSETVARRQEDGGWRLTGRKWFTSAVASQMALTLARPEGNPPGGKGLALFYLETRDRRGRLQGIRIERLKEKLGTRKLPTAELTLEGVPARPVMGLTDGVRNITPMLNITRLWNGISSIALMRRGLALAEDYAGKRVAFGARLADQPLHADTLDGLRAELAGALHLTFHVAGLRGRAEAGELDAEGERRLRVLTPIMKLLTAKQAVAVASEALECFGGAGYLEDTGLPMLLRDAQVLPIWEGTTNVLALEALRALDALGGLEPIVAEAVRAGEAVRAAGLRSAADRARRVLERAAGWLREAGDGEREAGARRFCLSVGRALELALLTGHAQWSLDREEDETAAAAARRLAREPLDLLGREPAPVPEPAASA